MQTVRAGAIAVIAHVSILALLWPEGAAGNPANFPTEGLRQGAPIVIEKVISHRLLLTKDGREFLLPAVAPAPAGHAYPDTTRRSLANHVEGQTTVPWFPAVATDRYDRQRAYLQREDGSWVQLWMARSGLIRITVPADAGREITVLLRAEAAARRSGVGLWALERQIGTPARPGQLGQFAIVEGVLVSAALIRGTLYLNFGADYRTDFTFRVPRAGPAGFTAKAFDPDILAGRRLRVRGWLDSYNGPEIQGYHPAQIEFVDTGN